MDYSIIIGGVSGLAALLLGKGIEWYTNRRKADSEDKKETNEHELKEEKLKAELSIPQNEQAVKFYSDLIKSMKEDMTKLVGNMEKQDGLLLNCREEKLSLKADKLALTAELDSVRKRVKELEERMTVQEAKHESTISQSATGLLPSSSSGTV